VAAAVTANIAGPSVGVICDQESHNGRLVKITVFGRRDDDGTWHELPLYREGHPEPSWNRHPPTWTVLHGDSIEHDRESWAGGRVQHHIVCDLCGLNASARAETLYPLLDKFADVGVSLIRLAALARSLSLTSTTPPGRGH